MGQVVITLSKNPHDFASEVSLGEVELPKSATMIARIEGAVMSKDKKASAKDAQVLIQLYDLRREPVMRQARKFMAFEFWPQHYDEFKALFMDLGSERNSWARQCLTYWDMAAAMVLQGAVSEDLFYAANGEPYFLFAKYGHYLPQLRKEYTSEFLINLEALCNRPKSKARIKEFQARVEMRRKAMVAKAAAGAS
jgi:hypothetical protein